MNTILNGHTSKETAHEIKNYPWGFKLKTSQFIWIETVPKKGDRVVRQTIDPKNGRLCAPKKSTFNAITWLYMDEQGHIQSDGLNIYSSSFEIPEGLQLNVEQQKRFNELRGINTKETDEFTGKTKKDFSVKWEKDSDGECDDVKITFDRPDGVMIKEIFEAMKSLNQERLNQVFKIRESKTWGDHPGIVRICTRGGMQLTTVGEDAYKEYLASDHNILQES